MNTSTPAMNEATQRMLQYAWWSTVIVAVGTIILVWNLIEIAKANAIMTRDQRPYIGISVSITNGLGYEDIEGKSMLRMRFNVRLINSGRSAAKIRFATRHTLNKRNAKIGPPDFTQGGLLYHNLVPNETVDIHALFSMLEKDVIDFAGGGAFLPTLEIRNSYRPYDGKGKEWINARSYTVWRKKEDGPLPAIKLLNIPDFGKI